MYTRLNFNLLFLLVVHSILIGRIDEVDIHRYIVECRDMSQSVRRIIYEDEYVNDDGTHLNNTIKLCRHMTTTRRSEESAKQSNREKNTS